MVEAGCPARELCHQSHRRDTRICPFAARGAIQSRADFLHGLLKSEFVGFLGRIKDGLARTKQQIVDRFDDIVRLADQPDRRSRPVDVETTDALEELLISADVGVAAADRIIASVRARERNGRSLRSLVKEEIRQLFAAADAVGATRESSAPVERPQVTLVVGVNGTGKTTTVGKLANLLKSEGRRPLICAADTFRAAAVEQLEVWAARAGVEMVRARAGADPAAVVFDAIASGKARGCDPILVDTAGRLHTRVNLMHELEKIRRVAARQVPGAPQEVLLVLDATVGQNGVTQAREFMSTAGVNGVVLTKLDGTAKGGVAVAIANDLQLPIRYVGVGEGIDDLVPFSADEYVDGLFAETW
jgi:fused signal recognition particle receptor